MPLWTHQQKALTAYAQSEKKRILLVSPTGSGKSTIGSEIAKNHPGKVLWIAHRDELLKQAIDTVGPGHISVQTIQTLLSRGFPFTPDLIIADECHHYVSDKWGELLRSYTGKLVGLTATPCRADGRGLGEIFEELIEVATVKELTDLGILVPCEIHGPKQPLKSNQLAQRPVDAWKTICPGDKTILFAPHIKAAYTFRDQFWEQGIGAEVVTGVMPMEERRGTIEFYRNDRFPVLINVGICTEGFDDKLTKCCIIARSCGSHALYLQMVGRVLRSGPGKTTARLIDLPGVSHVFGSPNEPLIYSLNGEGLRRNKQLDSGPERFCPVCAIVLNPEVYACPECGTETGVKLPKITNSPLVKYAKMRKKPLEDRLKWWQNKVAEAKAKGYKIGWAYHRYKAVFGEDPPRNP